MRIAPVLVLVVSGSLVAGGSTARAETPPRGEVGVEQTTVTYKGKGCPPGTAGVFITDDGLAFTAIYDQYTVQVGPGIPKTENSKKCELQVALRTPKGWQYTIEKVEFRGYSDLKAGMGASLDARYKLSGEPAERQDVINLAGPTQDNFFAASNFPEGGLTSQCGNGKNVKITTVLSVNNKGAKDETGLATMDMVDGIFQVIYRLSWKRCKQ
jgi:hypothetical protein